MALADPNTPYGEIGLSPAAIFSCIDQNSAGDIFVLFFDPFTGAQAAAFLHDFLDENLKPKPIEEIFKDPVLMSLHNLSEDEIRRAIDALKLVQNRVKAVTCEADMATYPAS